MSKHTFYAVLILALIAQAASAQGGGGEKLPAPAKPRPVLPRDAAPSHPPGAVAPARPVRPALSAVVITTNASDATITLNGRKAGVTGANNSLFVDSLRPGSYTVRITRPGYRKLESTAQLRAGVTETLNFELTPILQTLTIHSVPGESEVLVDEVSRGHTDSSGSLRLDLPIGVHRVTIRKPRFRDVQRAVALTEENAGNVAAELQLGVGILTVTTNVADASIEIVGIGRFKNAVEKMDCEPGTYQLTVARRFFQTASRQVSIAAGETLSVSVDLEPDADERGRLLTEAQNSYARRSYSNAIATAKEILSADPANASALTLVAQSAFMTDEFSTFTEYARQAIESGGFVDLQLRHHHAYFGGSLHFVRLRLTKEGISFDPQPSQIENGGCPNPPFTVRLATLKTAEASTNRDSETYLQLVFAEPANPKKTSTLKFADRESHSVRTTKTKSAAGIIGVTYEANLTVSRRQAYAAMSAVASLLNRAKVTSADTAATRNRMPEVVLSDSSQPAPAIDAIIQRSITVTGTSAPWASTIQTGTYTWTTPTTGESISGSYEEYIKAREGFFHSFNHEKTGFFLQEGFDGTTGWLRLAKQKPQLMPPDGLARLKRELKLAAFTNVNEFREIFPTAAVKSSGKLDGRDVYVIEAVIPAENRTETFYFEVETGLLIRRDTVYSGPKSKGKTVVTFLIESYGEVDGRKVVTRWKQISPSLILSVVISETKHDVPIDETKFKKPAK
jgi:hypothetical protein